MTSTTTLRPHHKHWPRRLPHAITPPATSLWDNLAVSARRYPDKPALIFFGRQTSYRELCEGTERLAAYLHSIGVRKGDRVILLMQNCRSWCLRTSPSCAQMPSSCPSTP